jgi:DNA-binding transcriptional LysR family regulator
MAFVGRKHPLAKHRSVSLNDFRSYPWASPLRSSLASTELLSLLGAAGIQPFDISVETDSFPTLRAVLKDGRHFVLNTPEIFAEDVRDGRVVALPIREKATVWRFGLKRRRDAFETPTMKVFADFVRQLVREQPAPKRGIFHNRQA